VTGPAFAEVDALARPRRRCGARHEALRRVFGAHGRGCAGRYIAGMTDRFALQEHKG
jgi:hypothetical protein